MKRIFDTLFSMKLAGAILVIMSVVLAMATFVENDFGAHVAREAIYASWWFEVLLFLLAINLSGAIYHHKLYKKEKWSRGFFHLAFVLILAGGFFTKHLAIEGMMHIREGECTSEISMDQSALKVTVQSEYETIDKSYTTTVNEFYKVDEININNDKDVKIDIYHYPIPNVPVIYESESGTPVLIIMFASKYRSFALGFAEGQSMVLDGTEIGFNTGSSNGIQFIYEQDTLYLISEQNLSIRRMMGGGEDEIILNDEKHLLSSYTIYETEAFRFVMTDFNASGIIRYEEEHSPQQAIPEMLMVVQDQEQTLFFPVPKSEIAMNENILMYNGITIRTTWQPNTVELPFSICLQDFVIERYPGSHSPSEYRSIVTLNDNLQNVSSPFEISMNNILKYSGYRFYQSSFDQDELGTILSVRKDTLGTSLSYLGYILMIVGMLWAIFDKRSRFRMRLNSLSTSKSIKAMLVIVLLFSGLGLSAQSSVEVPDKEIAKQFGEIQVLGANGRLMPVNTLTDEVLRTIYGKNHYHGMNSDQAILSMIANPQIWMGEEILKVKYEDLKKRIGIERSYASFNDIVDPETGSYMLSKDVEEAYRKKKNLRTKYDREVIKIDERLNVFYLILTNRYIKMYPVEQDDKIIWLAADHELTGLSQTDSVFIANTEGELSEALMSRNSVKSLSIINKIKQFQNDHAQKEIIPENKVKAEIFSNKIDVFKKLWRFYSTFGLFMIIVFIINVANPFRRYAWMSKVGFIHLTVAFVIHTAALGLRWYISGNAPMSNGYESLVFVAWSAMLAGLLFYKREPFALWATSLLAAMVLMVAHLSWMNPQISNLMPVLRSVWLTIHVSVITSSYGFLGLSGIIGLSAIIMQIAAGVNYKKNVEDAIKRLTTISEVIMIPGLYLLTIGTFLGAIWANVSWGRYWGWDPKETWALITILVYAFVLHMKYIPGLKGRYQFNVMSVIAFFSILMTYFGVNYYLSGLHSYAGGDPVPIPSWLYFAVGSLVILFVAGNFTYKSSRLKE